MATKDLVGGGDALTARRLRLLRVALGFAESKDFAAHLRIGYHRWNAFENGAPLSKEIAFLLRELTGVSLDWLWYGEPAGFSIFLRAVPPAAGQADHTDRQGRNRSRR